MIQNPLVLNIKYEWNAPTPLNPEELAFKIISVWDDRKSQMLDQIYLGWGGISGAILRILSTDPVIHIDVLEGRKYFSVPESTRACIKRVCHILDIPKEEIGIDRLLLQLKCTRREIQAFKQQVITVKNFTSWLHDNLGIAPTTNSGNANTGWGRMLGLKRTIQK